MDATHAQTRAIRNSTIMSRFWASVSRFVDAFYTFRFWLPIDLKATFSVNSELLSPKRAWHP